MRGKHVFSVIAGFCFALGGAFVACVGDTGGTSGKDSGTDATGNGDTGTAKDGGDSSTGACTTGQYQCDGINLQECQQGAYVTIKQCPTTELCQAHVGAQCGVAACSDGDMLCADGGVLETCNAGRTGFTSVQVCASAALCRTDAGADGGCLPPACQPGWLQCNSCPAPYAADDCAFPCKADLTGYETTYVKATDCGPVQGTPNTQTCCQNGTSVTCTPNGC